MGVLIGTDADDKAQVRLCNTGTTPIELDCGDELFQLRVATSVLEPADVPDEVRTALPENQQQILLAVAAQQRTTSDLQADRADENTDGESGQDRCYKGDKAPLDREEVLETTSSTPMNSVIVPPIITGTLGATTKPCDNLLEEVFVGDDGQNRSSLKPKPAGVAPLRRKDEEDAYREEWGDVHQGESGDDQHDHTAPNAAKLEQLRKDKAWRAS